MWRVAGAIALTFAAVAGSVFGVGVVFLIVPSLWEALFGQGGAAYGAIAALGLMVWGSARLLRFADRLLGEPDHAQPRPTAGYASPPYAVPLARVEQAAPSDWPEHTAEIVRHKRWAFYRRTRQFDRLAELEAESSQQTVPPR
jgi:hypothetical protein